VGKGRLEAFSDGVIAVIITIMVLELKVPHGSNLAALSPVIPGVLTYALSFVFVGIYWNNHHHMLHAVHTVNGPILWANLHLLFWLSLTPFATAWMGQSNFASRTVAIYGALLLMCAIAYTVLARALVAHEGANSPLAHALGGDVKGKISLGIYVIAIIVSFVNSWVSVGLYVIVALIWFLPDRRIEKALAE
jgi:TMEM175 potassium channel family protein